MFARPRHSVFPPLPFAIWCIFVIFVFASPAAFAWGASGHRLISQLAVEQLPPDIPAFLRTTAAAETIGEFGREPDRSRGGGLGMDHDLNPGHFINLDDDFTARGVTIDPLPATREDYDTALRQVGSNEYQIGFLPYAIVDGWLQLQKDFGYWRAAAAMERHATNAGNRAWFRRDRLRREMLILRNLGYWSHFVADASQPMHVSIHYDGWGDYPNPLGYAARRGFHAAFEGGFVAQRVTRQQVVQQLAPAHDCECTIQVRTLAYLRNNHAQLERLFLLERAGAFTDPDNREGEAFAAERLAAAGAELRDLVVMAWHGSLAGSVGYPPVAVSDVIMRKANPVRQMRGED